MNLVVDDVEQQAVSSHLPLSKGVVALLKGVWRDLGPESSFVHGNLIPKLKKVGLCAGSRHILRATTTRDHPLQGGNCHPDKLHYKLGKCSHPAD